MDLSFNVKNGTNVSGNIDVEMPFDYSEKAKSSGKKGVPEMIILGSILFKDHNRK